MAKSHHQYISVMSAAASAGDVQVEIESLDAIENLTISASITGIDAADSEISIARRIEEQLQVILTQHDANYEDEPTPRFQDEGYPARFRLGNTDHVVSLWSQARFRITVDSSETGAIIKTSTSPSLLTIQDARNIGIFSDFLFRTPGGATLTDDQIAELLLMMSGEFIALINNPIVVSGYLKVIRGKDHYGTQLLPRPGLKLDNGRTRFKEFAGLIDPYQFTGPSVLWDGDRNFIQFRYESNLAQVRDPFAWGNQTLQTYVAGEIEIPEAIKRALAGLARGALSGQTGQVESLQGGSFRVKFFAPKDFLYMTFLPIRKYILR